MNVLDVDGGVVNQDADREREAAERHDVDGFAEEAKNQSEVRMESGMEMQTIRVLRQLPRNSRIMRPVRPAAIRASRSTPSIAARTKTD